jgi:hypothetical protein
MKHFNLIQLEKIKCFTDIDGKITEAEINSAIKEMKSNKSTGLDNISNEMLKSGQSFLIPCLPLALLQHSYQKICECII